MYVPKHFAETDCTTLADIMRASSFASLVTTRDGLPVATHLPLYLDADRGEHGTLLGHVARANDHWRLFDGNSAALAIFGGIHSYIGPNWYGSQNAVPTWNYLAVHAYGAPQVVEDPAAVLDILERLTASYETDTSGNWRMDRMEPDLLHGMLKGIVAFEMPIDRIDGKAKMGQNKKPEEIRGAVRGLRSTGEPMATAVASEMERRLKK